MHSTSMRIRGMLKRTTYVMGLFLSFFGVFFAVQPKTPSHSPVTGLSEAEAKALTVPSVEFGVPYAYAETTTGGDSGGDGDDCGDDGGDGDGDDAG